MNRVLVRAVCVAAFATMVAFIFLEAEPSPDAWIQLLPPWDKMVHFLYYGLMAALLAHGAGRRWLWLPLLLVPAIGLADELNQAGIPGRNASVLDWVADLLGAVAAVYVYRRLPREVTADR